MILTS
jgi:hypothetical protein